MCEETTTSSSSLRGWYELAGARGLPCSLAAMAVIQRGLQIKGAKMVSGDIYVYIYIFGNGKADEFHGNFDFLFLGSLIVKCWRILEILDAVAQVARLDF